LLKLSLNFAKKAFETFLTMELRYARKRIATITVEWEQGHVKAARTKREEPQ